MILQGAMMGGFILMFVFAFLFLVFTPLSSVFVDSILKKIFNKNGKFNDPKPFWSKVIIVLTSIILGVLFTIITMIILLELFFKNVTFD